MPALLMLPVELLTEIAKLVPQPIDLTAVCRLLNDVATPVAYRALTLPLSHNELEQEPGTIARALGRLLRTLMARPSVGMHVRHLDISFYDVPFPRDDEQATKIPEDIRVQAMEAASSHGLSDSIREQLADGMLGAAFLLLLCHFPNLDSLDLIPECGGDFWNHIASSSMLPCGLRSLRSVLIPQYDVREDTQHKNIFALFCFPSLRTLRWEIFESIYSERNPLSDQMVLFGGTSRIEDINIVSNQVDTWALAAMVRSVQRLRSFCYNEHQGVVNKNKPFFGALLGGALQAHVHTLENLEIRVIEVDYERHTSIGSLRKYTKLTRLGASLPVLLGHPDPQPNIEMPRPRRIGELLPQSLISFDVSVDPRWQHTAGGCLMQFIEIDLKHVPNFKRLSLCGHITESDIIMLQEACFVSGIPLRLSNEHYRCRSASLASSI